MSVQISIIIPCYNQEKFLDKCLCSVVSQSFQDWECLLVNDGSTDNTAEILENWQAKDQRFRVIHQQNTGVSTARNNGLDKSTGDFVVFLDSDDWFADENALLNFTSVMDENPTIINADFCFVHQEDKITYPKESERIKSVHQLKGAEMLTGYLNGKISGIGCNKMLSRDFLNQNSIRFKTDLAYSEDMLLLLECFTLADKIISIPFITYCYNRANENSVTAQSGAQSTSRWQSSQLKFIGYIAELIHKYPRWKEIDTSVILKYFTHQYGFLKNEPLLKDSKTWKLFYKKIQQIYHLSSLHLWQKRFIYNAEISYFSYSRIKKMKNSSSYYYKLLSKFVTF